MDSLQTLNKFQKLLGNINLLSAHLHLTTGDLKPLFNILKGGQASVICDGHRTVINTSFSSLQLVELVAVALALRSTLDVAVNIYTNSKYVFLSVPQLDTCSFLPGSSAASPLFSRICTVIRQHTCPFFIGHIRAHSNLPGPLVEGNHLADSALCIYSIDTATKDHVLHHLNAHTLHLKHNTTQEQA